GRKREVRKRIIKRRLAWSRERRDPARHRHPHAEIQRDEDAENRCLDRETPVVAPPEDRMIVEHRRGQLRDVERSASEIFFACHAVTSTGGATSPGSSSGGLSSSGNAGGRWARLFDQNHAR